MPTVTEPIQIETAAPLCLCGCGQPVKPGRKLAGKPCSALVRADAVIRAAQADLVAAQERGAELERALDHERCLLQTDEDGMDDGSGEAITRIEQWDDYSPVGGHALFAFVREHWWSPGWGISAEQTEEGVEYHLSTGGWSGNEVIVDALQRNRMVHSCWWQSSRRGGHYVYLVPTVESA